MHNKNGYSDPRLEQCFGGCHPGADSGQGKLTQLLNHSFCEIVSHRLKSRWGWGLLGKDDNLPAIWPAGRSWPRSCCKGQQS